MDINTQRDNNIPLSPLFKYMVNLRKNMLYTIEQIQAIQQGVFVLPKETIDLLAHIEKNLDIPPLQPGSGGHNDNYYSSSDRQYKHGNGQNYTKSTKPTLVKSSKFAALEEDAASQPVFKTTKFAVKTGITKQINEIRMKINNLSNSTYSKNSEAVIELIRQWEPQSENWELDLKQICDAVFDIVSKTKLNSDLNAALYKLCISHYDQEGSAIFTEMINNGVNTLETMIDTAEYADPNQDYDKYCVYSKQTAQIIGMATFYVNSMKISMVSLDKIYTLLENLLEKIEKYTREEDKVATVELLAEVVFVIVEACHLAMTFDKPDLLKKVVDIAGYKNKQYPSVSNRFVFKFMDMRDLINKA